MNSDQILPFYLLGYDLSDSTYIEDIKKFLSRNEIQKVDIRNNLQPKSFKKILRSDKVQFLPDSYLLIKSIDSLQEVIGNKKKKKIGDIIDILIVCKEKGIKTVFFANEKISVKNSTLKTLKELKNGYINEKDEITII